jgi:hypothetical protein
MTGCADQAAAEIELYFYDELDPRVRAAVENHLRSCTECRLALDELATIRSGLRTRPRVDAPPDGDWTPFMERLADACQQVSRDPWRRVDLAVVDDGEGRECITNAPHRADVSYLFYLAMAALLTLVTAGVVYVARSVPRPAASPATTASQNAMPAPGAIVPAAERSVDAAFAALSEQHFERAKLVVLGLANKDPLGARAADWAYERGLATNLLSDTRLYRQAAEARGMRTLAGVMGDLEIVLLQTSLAAAPDADALGQIQRLIHKRDLVTKMDVTGAGLAGS